MINIKNGKLIVDISYKSFLLKNLLGGFPRKLAIMLKINKKFYNHYMSNINRLDDDVLRGDKLKKVLSFEDNKCNDKYILKKSNLIPNGLSQIDNNSQRSIKIMPVIDDLIHETKPKRIVNIGARIDFVSAFFSKRYPDIEFVSVDFQKDLKEMNRFFKYRDNWKFIEGYAYDLFKNGVLDADIVIFSSVMTLFPNKELHAYLKEMKKHVKYIVLNEPFSVPIKPFKPFRLIKPNDISIDETYVGGSFFESLCTYEHSYFKLFKRYNYDIDFAKLTDSSWRSKQYLLQMVVKNGC